MSVVSFLKLTRGKGPKIEARGQKQEIRNATPDN
jgi:hypothetical protein